MNVAAEPDVDIDEAARQLYAEWCADWRELDAFVASQLAGELKGLTPRRVVAAMQGMARPHIARPLLHVFIDRTPWSPFHHRHHFTDRLPIRGHVYIAGAPTTSNDDGHFHMVDPATTWTAYETIDFSLFA